MTDDRHALECKYARTDDVTLPPERLPTATCTTCKGTYLDNEAGHDAHLIVFGHQPNTGEWT